MLFLYDNRLAMPAGINRRMERERNIAAIPPVTAMRSAMAITTAMTIAPNMANTDVQTTSITHAPSRVPMPEMPPARSVCRHGSRADSKEYPSKNYRGFHARQHVASAINS